jgi:hypothetical protein
MRLIINYNAKWFRIENAPKTFSVKTKRQIASLKAQGLIRIEK